MVFQRLERRACLVFATFHIQAKHAHAEGGVHGGGGLLQSGASDAAALLFVLQIQDSAPNYFHPHVKTNESISNGPEASLKMSLSVHEKNTCSSRRESNDVKKKKFGGRNWSSPSARTEANVSHISGAEMKEKHGPENLIRQKML